MIANRGIGQATFPVILRPVVPVCLSMWAYDHHSQVDNVPRRKSIVSYFFEMPAPPIRGLCLELPGFNFNGPRIPLKVRDVTYDYLLQAYKIQMDQIDIHPEEIGITYAEFLTTLRQSGWQVEEIER
jgi:hypothetical protein